MSKRIANRTHNVQNRLSSTMWLAKAHMTEDAEKYVVETYKKVKLLFAMIEACDSLREVYDYQYEPIWSMKRNILDSDGNIRKALSRQGYVTIRCVEFNLRYAQSLLSKYDLL